MGNYVIGVGNYVIATPSELGNYKIADTHAAQSCQPWVVLWDAAWVLILSWAAFR